MTLAQNLDAFALSFPSGGIACADMIGTSRGLCLAPYEGSRASLHLRALPLHGPCSRATYLPYNALPSPIFFLHGLGCYSRCSYFSFFLSWLRGFLLIPPSQAVLLLCVSFAPTPPHYFSSHDMLKTFALSTLPAHSTSTLKWDKSHSLSLLQGKGPMHATSQDALGHSPAKTSSPDTRGSTAGSVPTCVPNATRLLHDLTMYGSIRNSTNDLHQDL